MWRAALNIFIYSQFFEARMHALRWTCIAGVEGGSGEFNIFPGNMTLTMLLSWGAAVSRSFPSLMMQQVNFETSMKNIPLRGNLGATGCITQWNKNQNLFYTSGKVCEKIFYLKWTWQQWTLGVQGTRFDPWGPTASNSASNVLMASSQSGRRVFSTHISWSERILRP